MKKLLLLCSHYSKVVLLALLAYLLAPFFLFNNFEASFLFDEEYRKGKQVAAGPKPFYWVTKPSYANLHYTGEEAIFKIFFLHCRAWNYLHGYENPQD